MSTAETPYPTVDPKLDLPALEERMLSQWKDEDAFATSVDSRPATNEYVFYDGPPFANGLPHHGHLLTGYIKDVIPRYQTMRGKRVERRFARGGEVFLGETAGSSFGPPNWRPTKYAAMSVIQTTRNRNMISAKPPWSRMRGKATAGMAQ